MSLYLCAGSKLKCSMGTAPATLNILPVNRVLINNMPAGNIMDNKPVVNILPFAMCTSLANPAVAAATSAAGGALTPMPCIPNTPAPWFPGEPKLLIGNLPALTDSCKLMCMWAGVIDVIKGN